MSGQRATTRLLTVSEAMATLSVSRTTIYGLFKSGALRWVQVGAHRRVSSREIERFITANTKAAS
jgi:excisionase family DNA binding protein